MWHDCVHVNRAVHRYVWMCMCHGDIIMQCPSPLQPVATWMPNRQLFLISDLRHSLEKEGQKGIRPPILLFPSAPCSSSQHCPLVSGVRDSVLFTLSFTFALLSVLLCCVAHPLSKHSLSLPVSFASVLLQTELLSSFSFSFYHFLFVFLSISLFTIFFSLLTWQYFPPLLLYDPFLFCLFLFLSTLLFCPLRVRSQRGQSSEGVHCLFPSANDWSLPF